MGSVDETSCASAVPFRARELRLCGWPLVSELSSLIVGCHARRLLWRVLLGYVVRAEQLLEERAVVHERLALRLRAYVGLLLRQVEGVRGSVVLHHVGVIDRDVGGLLFEIVNGITTFAHHLGDESVCVTNCL